MSYIRDSLGANEAVHYVAHFHWIRHAMGYGVLALSILVAIFSYSPEYPFVVLGPVLLGVILFLAIMVPIWTTEIGVTSQRLILKRGLIQRDTEEMTALADTTFASGNPSCASRAQESVGEVVCPGVLLASRVASTSSEESLDMTISRSEPGNRGARGGR
jgi:hypothetical protein